MSKIICVFILLWNTIVCSDFSYCYTHIFWLSCNPVNESVKASKIFRLIMMQIKYMYDNYFFYVKECSFYVWSCCKMIKKFYSNQCKWLHGFETLCFCFCQGIHCMLQKHTFHTSGSITWPPLFGWTRRSTMPGGSQMQALITMTCSLSTGALPVII